MKPSGFIWPRGMTAHTPIGEAASLVLAARLGEAAKLLGRAARSKPGTPEAEKSVHALRVATRRGAATLGVFAPVLRGKDAKWILRRLRAIRRSAGEARDLDVQIEILGAAMRATKDKRGRAALRRLGAQTRADRREAHKPIERLARKWTPASLRKSFEKVVERVGEGKGGAEETTSQTPLIDVARRAVEREIGLVEKAGSADLLDVENVHALRLRLKRLRYTMEVVGVCFGDAWRRRIRPELVLVQRCLGEINDAHVLLRRLMVEEKKPGRVPAGLAALVRDQREALTRAHAAFLEQWKAIQAARFLARMRGEFGVEGGEPEAPGVLGANPPAESIPTRVLRPVGVVEVKPGGLNGTHAGAGKGRKSGVGGRRRLAAIDVGTNSVRLIVADAQPDGSYRILDDEKEITRLGKGLSATGRMEAAAIEHTVVTIARMKSIAQGYGSEEIQVVGTSAAREAKNAGVLEKQIKQRTGLDLEVISGEEEAMLAYRSAANAFDLAGVSGAVVDIGGGSTEIVLSAAAGPGSEARRAGLGGGVIERVYTIPMGAVRLTDKFGGPEECAGERFEEMRGHVKSLLKQHVGRPPLVPQLVVGTGGTLTTLAAMVLQRELGPSGDGLFAGGVQGLEVGRADLRHLLEYLRKLPVKERTRVPGLSADRADIIVAGLAIVDGVLKRFGANRVRIHEGGIRDGILLSMVGASGAGGGVGGAGESGEARRDPMKGVRRLAKACGYEALHAKHVTGLALQIFDQMAGQRDKVRVEDGMSFEGEARVLMEAASLLHDIGYLINYAQHHKHSYHLIVHADLPGFTTRQVQVVANVARYHRAAEPKSRHRTFATLSKEDQALVRGLSAILRIADGLDRTHMQSVRSVGVRIHRGAAFLSVAADSEPAVDMWGAVRKSGLFKEVFGLLPHLEWTRGEAIAAAKPLKPEGAEV